MKHRCKYEYTNQHGTQNHTWSVISGAAGLHLHIHGHKVPDREIAWHGGIEIHYRNPPSWSNGCAPTSDDCWLLKCPCWHDGSSLEVDERWIPLWKQDPHGHDFLFSALCSALDQRVAEATAD